jgi:Zn-dependent M28 family amino/carboxypeptidase
MITRTLFCLGLWSLASCSPSLLNRIYRETDANSRAYATLDSCIQVTTHRLTGTDNGRRAEEFAGGLFRQYDLDTVWYQPFTVHAWQRGTLSVSLQRPDFMVLPSVCLAYSPLRFEGSAQLIDAGEGYRTDFDSLSGRAKGHFVLIDLAAKPNTQNLHRSEKMSLAVEYGAAGAVFVNDVDGRILLTGTASNTSELLDIPAVCIAREDGRLLRQHLDSGVVELTIRMTNSADDITARNVIAEIPGSERPEEIIVIGGHLDSWDLANGAIDNGIGSFTVLDVARTFRALGLRPRRTVRFVMFMGEEQGLLGSKALVQQWRKDGTFGRVKYMLNLDMHGNTIGINLGGREEARDFFEKVGRRLRQFDTTFYNQISTHAGLHSDHESFLLEGIPTLNFRSNLDPTVYRYYHSNGDLWPLVNKSHMEKAVKCVTYVLYELANAAELPACTLNDVETRNFLIRHDLKEALQLGNKWKWDK